MSTPIPSFSVPSPFKVTRRSKAGKWTAGRWEETPQKTSFSIMGSVQRLSMHETMLLPESYRTKKAYRIYTESQLRVVDEATGFEADEILLFGETYTVIDVEHWTQLMPHYKAIVVRQERNAQ